MTQPAAAERVVARSGMPAWCHPAEAPRGGVVVVGVPVAWGGGAEPPRNAPPRDAEAGPEAERPAARAEAGEEARAEAPKLPAEIDALRRAGFTVLLPDLCWRRPGADDLEAGSDPEAIADIGAARALLPAGPRFVVGVGRGGVYARLAACAVLGLDGAVSLGGRVWYSGVSPQRPIQPLDLLPGLACPLQAHFDLADPESPPGQVDELERRLGAVSRPWQVFRYEPGPAEARWAGPRAATAWGRARAFLLHLAAERAG